MLSTILDVALGVVFVFIIFSTVASGIHEFIARMLATRSKQLWRALGVMLDDMPTPERRMDQAKTAALGLTGKRDARPERSASTEVTADGADDERTTSQKLFAHDLINGLDNTAKRGRTRLSHIEPDVFSRALLDVVSGNETLEDTRAARRAIGALKSSRLKNELTAVARHADNDIQKLRDDLGRWFDIHMEALTQAYRRRTRWWLFLVGLIVAVGFNVDAIRVTNGFYEDDALRALVVAEAESLVGECTFTNGNPDEECKTKIEAASEALELPLWWGDDAQVDALSIIGWIIAAAAIAQGGPFWFDVLRRIAGFKKAAMSTG